MRVLVNNQYGTKLRIKELIITKNFWEYYVIDENNYIDKDLITALVMGVEIEIGDVYLPEIEPYIFTRTKNLDVLPATGYHWEDEK